MNSTSISTAATLPALAAAINAEHRQAETALHDGLRHAVEAGRLLLEAKAKVSHGEWLPWLESNFDGTKRTARLHARGRQAAQLEKQTGNAVANLSFRQALRLTAPPRPTKEIATDQGQGKRFLDAPLDVRQKTCGQWWDILASHALMLDAAGWGPAKIAETLAVETADSRDPEPAATAIQLCELQPPRGHGEMLCRCRGRTTGQPTTVGPLNASTRQSEGFPEVIPLLQAMEAKQQRLQTARALTVLSMPS